MLLAGATFVIAALAVFRLDAGREASRRSGGTGGFTWIGESTLPVLHNLKTAAGRDDYGVAAEPLRNAKIVQLRVRNGDDASCLNLDRAQQPRLLGVDPRQLDGRFTFLQVLPGTNPKARWELLKASGENDDAIPAIGDANSIRWALGKKLGDILEIRASGRTIKVRLVGAIANSVLQGSLLIDEVAFVRAFPGETGWRMLLIAAPIAEQQSLAAALNHALGDIGLELTPTVERLTDFNAVQNTYLGTFQVLGGLGLLLGSAGLGAVVLRNVLERRAELAVMLALGYRRRDLRVLVLGEHAFLLTTGLAIGIGAAAVAVIPAVIALKTEIPWVTLGITLAAVLVNGLVCTWAATSLALKGELLTSLRSD
jgi:putative ABC transport system permease protein